MLVNGRPSLRLPARLIYALTMTTWTKVGLAARAVAIAAGLYYANHPAPVPELAAPTATTPAPPSQTASPQPAAAHQNKLMEGHGLHLQLVRAEPA